MPINANKSTLTIFVKKKFLLKVCKSKLNQSITQPYKKSINQSALNTYWYWGAWWGWRPRRTQWMLNLTTRHCWTNPTQLVYACAFLNMEILNSNQSILMMMENKIKPFSQLSNMNSRINTFPHSYCKRGVSFFGKTIFVNKFTE